MPIEPFAVPTDTLFVDALDALDPLDPLEYGDGLAAGVLELEVELLLPHPATTSATRTAAAPPSRSFALVPMFINSSWFAFPGDPSFVRVV